MITLSGIQQLQAVGGLDERLLREQIEIRKDLLRQLVGNTYPAMMRVEVFELERMLTALYAPTS